MYKCRQLSSVGYYLKSQFEVVRLIFHLPKSNKGRKDDYLIALGEWSDSLHCPTWARNPGGVPLGLVSLEKGLTISALTYIYIFSLLPFLAMIFVNLTLIFFLDIFVDRDHVSPKLNHTNVQALNYLLRSKIFVSEGGQLRAALLILGYEPLSCTFQDVGQAIRAGSSRLAQIDVSKPGFLARRDLPPISRLVLQNPLPAALSFPQAPLDFAAIPTKGVASSRLSLEEEIDKFHFEEEQSPRALLICI